jgi:hypothetical protein
VLKCCDLLLHARNHGSSGVQLLYQQLIWYHCTIISYWEYVLPPLYLDEPV